MQNIIGLKEFRENTSTYLGKVNQGQSFIVFIRSKPAFKISPIADGDWEEVADFTMIKKGGVNIKDLLKRL
jgi:antitoxin (DNA-binding transcriptional repressor) of toxin-antitoxin stability system